MSTLPPWCMVYNNRLVLVVMIKSIHRTTESLSRRWRRTVKNSGRTLSPRVSREHGTSGNLPWRDPEQAGRERRRTVSNVYNRAPYVRPHLKPSAGAFTQRVYASDHFHFMGLSWIQIGSYQTTWKEKKNNPEQIHELGQVIWRAIQLGQK